MGKKEITSKKKFKEIVLTWWVWVIIAIVSYFIFASIPITWNESGFGWDTFAGLNFIKTILAYFTKIAWIVAVSLIIVSGIKYIQKTKINEYWKIALTILGIVLIIIYAFSSFSHLLPDSQVQEGEVKGRGLEFLEEDGYEVISFGSLDLNETYSISSVTMKSLGSRDNQILRGLLYLGSDYPNSSEYFVTILSPTDECSYKLKGNVWRNYLTALKNGNVTINGVTHTAQKISSAIDYALEDSKICK